MAFCSHPFLKKYECSLIFEIKDINLKGNCIITHQPEKSIIQFNNITSTLKISAIAHVCQKMTRIIITHPEEQQMRHLKKKLLSEKRRVVANYNIKQAVKGTECSKGL